MKIAIQGNPGSFHHIVARRWYGEDSEYICVDSFREVFACLYDGRADAAVTAVENSLYGSINEVYDLLLKHDFPIVGEVSERIHQTLIGLPEAELADITDVFSHPIALAQCGRYLDTQLPAAERIEHHDTAAAVEYIKRNRDPASAAIASHLAAEMHDMQVLAEDIQDEKLNYTRFLIIEPGGSAVASADKASLVITTAHHPGALYEALGVFAASGSNLTKLQSRPIAGHVWKYQFYIDVMIGAEKLAAATDQLQRQGCEIKTLGHYPAANAVHDD